MEKVNFRTLADVVYEIVVGIQKARNLVEDGKEIPCARKLQGVEFKSRQLLEFLNSILKEQGADTVDIMAAQSDETSDSRKLES